MKYFLIAALLFAIDCNSQVYKIPDSLKYLHSEIYNVTTGLLLSRDTVVIKQDTSDRIIVLVIDTTMLPDQYVSGTNKHYSVLGVIATGAVDWTWGYRVTSRRGIKYLNIYKKEFDKKLLIKEY